MSLKKILNKLAFILVVLTVISCSKSDENIKPTLSFDQSLLIGSWSNTFNGFEESTFDKVSKLGEFNDGFVFYEDGSFVERGSGGICVGEFCLRENYQGKWNIKDKNTITINVGSLAGTKNFELQIVEIDSKFLKAKIK